MSKRSRRIRAAKKPADRRPVLGEFRISGASGPLTIRAAEGEGADKKLRTFSMLAYTGAPMRPEGWWTPVIVDLAGVRVSSQHRPILRQHDHTRIVGHSTKVAVGADGIRIDGVLSGVGPDAAEVAALADNGFQWQASIGANPVRTEFLEAGEETEVNGRTVTGPMTISRETDLGESSFVPLGADGDTSATVSASRGGSRPMNVKAALKAIAAGKYTDAEIDEMSDADAKAALKKCMAAAVEDDDPDDTDTEAKAAADAKARAAAAIKAEVDAATKAMRAEAAAELRRQNEIRARLVKYPDAVAAFEVDGEGGKKVKANLIEHALANDWTPDQAELHALRLARPQHGGGPHLHFPTQPVASEAVLECAVFDALPQFRLFDSDFYRLNEDGKRRVSEREERRITAELNARYPDQVRQAAHTLYKGRIGLQQLLTTLAAANGYRGPATFNDPSGWGEVAAHLAQPIRADGASSVNTPATLANVQNKFMLQGYMFTEQTFLEIGAVLPVKDLKPTKSVQLFGDFQFQPLNPGGAIQHATVGDNPYANQAYLQARMITLELQYLINDDLGMFGQVPMMLGRGWGLRLNDLFWTAFMNPGLDEGGSTNFYAATHTITGQSGNSNLSSGAGSTLSHAGLQAAKLLFDNQVDPAGKPLGVDAELLVYPPDLDVSAVELMNAQFIVMAGLASTSAASKQANTNIWKGRFRPLMSRYLNKSAYTGNSTAAWYLLANPAIIPVIQIAALNGQMTPVVQTASQDWQFNMLGISMRGWGGVGVSMQNFRGAVKSNGS